MIAALSRTSRRAREVLGAALLAIAIATLRALDSRRGDRLRAELEELVRRAAYGPPPAPRQLGPLMRPPSWDAPQAMQSFVEDLRARRASRDARGAA
jgi:hypothetical protein